MIKLSDGSRGAGVRGFDMTPMIDVVLQLIIFFMFTSQFGHISRTSVDLPRERGVGEAEPARPDFVVDIDAEGALSLEGRPITLERLVTLVSRRAERMGAEAGAVAGSSAGDRGAGADGGPRVLVRPDRHAAAAHLNRLTEALARAGVRRWSMGTNAGAGGGGGP